MNRNTLKRTGAALAFTAAVAGAPTASATPAEKAPSSDIQHALRQARVAGGLATKHALDDMREEVHAKGLRNIHSTGSDVIVAVKNPEEGQPFILVSIDVNVQTVEVSEGTTLNMTQPAGPQNSVLTEFTSDDFSAINIKLGSGKKVTVRDAERALTDARLLSLEETTDADKLGNFKTLYFDGLHTQFTTGPGDEANPYQTASERQVVVVTEATHYVDSVLSANPAV